MNMLSEERSNTVSFGHKLAMSDAFKALFREGMTLVEDAAAYLDGPGRAASKTLARPQALAYASESMRLTTRLMQLASWLLLQRAVNEGEMTQTQAAKDKHRVRVTRQDIATDSEVFLRLPEALQDLVAQSLRLQERIMHLDRLLYADADRAAAAAAPAAPLGLEQQFARLREAFDPRG
ncbi:MAG TPA: DUF1465 family protein [Beijerinckiaceae bacterium]|jgi:regulator of CtrA degradation